MTWIRVETTVGDNDKVHLLAERLGVPVAQAVGHLVMLWGHVAAQRGDGDLSGVPALTVERWADWRGAAGVFDAALRQGFVQDGVIHGWRERQGKLIEGRARNAHRMRTVRARASATVRDVHDTEETTPVATQPARRNSKRNENGVIVEALTALYGKRPPERLLARELDLAKAIREEQRVGHDAVAVAVRGISLSPQLHTSPPHLRYARKAFPTLHKAGLDKAPLSREAADMVARIVEGMG